MKLTFTFLFLLITSYHVTGQIEIYDSNIEEKLIVHNDRLILLDFYATWCAPCKQMDPILKELTREYPNVDFYKIDVDKNEFAEIMEIKAMPTYMFIKNGQNLYAVEGAMSKNNMAALIDEFLQTQISTETSLTTFDPKVNHNKPEEFSPNAMNNLWNSWSDLNSLAWHAYEEHIEIDALLQSIKMVERSIALNKNYYNLDTHAALLYKTGRYTEALKKAKEAIALAQNTGIYTSGTTDLMNKIIDKM